MSDLPPEALAADPNGEPEDTKDQNGKADDDKQDKEPVEGSVTSG